MLAAVVMVATIRCQPMSPGQATSMTPPSPRVLPETLAPPLRPHMHLPLRPRAPDGSEDGCSLCVDSRRGSSMWPQWCWRHKRRQHAAERVKVKEKEKVPAKDAPSNSKRQGEGRRKEGDARMRGGPLIYSSNPPARGHAGPTTLVVASTANRHYIGHPPSAVANLPTSTSRGHGRRGRGGDRRTAALIKV